MKEKPEISIKILPRLSTDAEVCDIYVKILSFECEFFDNRNSQGPKKATKTTRTGVNNK